MPMVDKKSAGKGIPITLIDILIPMTDKRSAQKGIRIALIDIPIPMTDKRSARKGIRIVRVTIYILMIGKYYVMSSKQSFDTTCHKFIEGLRVTHFKSKFACHSSVDRNPLWITR